jgi:hypothetical protein
MVLGQVLWYYWTKQGQWPAHDHHAVCDGVRKSCLFQLCIEHHDSNHSRVTDGFAGIKHHCLHGDSIEHK